jgi:small-conductance mechanosensitive channel
MLAEEVKADYKDFIALTIAMLRILLPAILIIIFALILAAVLIRYSGYWHGYAGP